MTEQDYRTQLLVAVSPIDKHEEQKVKAAVNIAARVLFNLERIAGALESDDETSPLFEAPDHH